MIIRILQGADIATEPVEFPKSTELYLNLDAAKKIGINISRNIIEQATKIIDINSR